MSHVKSSASSGQNPVDEDLGGDECQKSNCNQEVSNFRHKDALNGDRYHPVSNSTFHIVEKKDVENLSSVSEKMKSDQNEDANIFFFGDESEGLQKVNDFESVNLGFSETEMRNSNLGSGGNNTEERDLSGCSLSNVKILQRAESSADIKRLKHREAQRKYKKTLAQNLKELRAYKVHADNTKANLIEQLTKKENYLRAIEVVVQVQNEEIFQLKTSLAESRCALENGYCACRNCGSHNFAN